MTRQQSLKRKSVFTYISWPENSLTIFCRSIASIKSWTILAYSSHFCLINTSWSSLRTLSFSLTNTSTIRLDCSINIGGCLLLFLLKKNFILSTEVIRFWKRIVIKSILLVYEYSSIFILRYYCLSVASHKYTRCHYSASFCLYISPSFAINYNIYAIHLTIQLGMSSKKPYLILWLWQIYKSFSATGPTDLNICEFLS